MELGTYRLAEINKGGGLRQKAVGLATQYLNGVGEWVTMPTSMTPTAHTHPYAGSDEAGGPAKTATKLATTRALTIGNTAKNFDGSAGVSWTLAEIGANQWKDGIGSSAIMTKNATAAGLRSGDGAKPYVYWNALAGQDLKAGGLAGTDQSWAVIPPNTNYTYAYGGVEYAYNNTSSNYIFLAIISSPDFIGSTTPPFDRIRLVANGGKSVLTIGRTITNVSNITGNAYSIFSSAGTTEPTGIDYTQAVTIYAFLKSANTDYQGYASVASSSSSVASGQYSVASGAASVASGYASVASGYYSVASNYFSVASGAYSVASGESSVASGAYSVASGYSSVALGNYSVASSYYSVASGYYSVASGLYSVALGRGTIAGGSNQTVIGKWNLANTTDAFIIGNGSNEASRANCMTVDFSGNMSLAGSIAIGANKDLTIPKHAGLNRLAYFDSAGKLQSDAEYTLSSFAEASHNHSITDLYCGVPYIDPGRILISGSGGSSNPTWLDAGTNGKILGWTSGAPAWVDAASTHNHDSAYSAIGHDHSGTYALASHTHSGYATSTHNHDATYLKLSGGTVTGKITLDTNGGIYKSGWDGNRIAYFVSGDLTTSSDYTTSSFALAGHNHDSEYAAASHTHSGYAASTHDHDSTYLKLSGGTMTGSLSGTTGSFSSSVSAASFSGVGSSLTSLNASNISSGVLPIFAKNFSVYDVAAYNKRGTPVFESSVDGSTWTTISGFMDLFYMKQNSVTPIQINDSNPYVRVTWENCFSWAVITSFVIGVKWSSPLATVSAKLYSSADGSSWTLRGSLSALPVVTETTIPCTNNSGDGYIRIVFERTNESGSLNICSIRLLSPRCGDQGGSDAQSLIYSVSSANNEVTFPAGVTATTFTGAGSSITSLNASNLSSGTVPIGTLPVGTESTQVSRGDHTHSGYAASTHNHDSAYSAIGHDHSGTYALASHTHSGYATSTHNHDATYLKLSGGTVTGKITLDTNGGIYKSGWDGNRIAYFVSGDLTTSSEYTTSSFATAGHTHSGYAASTHNHSIPELYCGVPNIVPGRILISGSGASSYPTWLEAGENGKILGWTSGAPAWVDAPSGSSVTAANPTASVGLTAVNGSATTFMRSDAAPKLDVTIAPTWTGNHTFSGLTKLANVGIGVDPSTSYKLYVVEDKAITTAGSYIGNYLIAKYNTELTSGTRQGIALLGQLWATGGTLTNAKGLDFKVYVPSGTVTEATAINAVIQTDGGSIGTAYALKLSRSGTAPTVANYGIYQDDSAATNVFNGPCEFNGGTNLATGRVRNFNNLSASATLTPAAGTDLLVFFETSSSATQTLTFPATNMTGRAGDIIRVVLCGNCKLTFSAGSESNKLIKPAYYGATLNYYLTTENTTGEWVFVCDGTNWRSYMLSPLYS